MTTGVSWWEGLDLNDMERRAGSENHQAGRNKRNWQEVRYGSEGESCADESAGHSQAWGRLSRGPGVLCPDPRLRQE